MYYKIVDNIPKRRRRRKSKRKNVVEYLDRFMSLNAKKAVLVFDENDYKDAESAYGSFWVAIVRDKYPIVLAIREGSLYLKRTDI